MYSWVNETMKNEDRCINKDYSLMQALEDKNSDKVEEFETAMKTGQMVRII